LQSKKQKIIVYIFFLFSRVELNIPFLYLKNSFSSKKLFIVSIFKTKIAKNETTCKEKIANLLKNNKITIIKKIVNIYKYKNYKYINI